MCRTQLGYKPRAVSRMNLRHRHIIAPWADQIAGSRVLDLGSHDGRWPYAFAAAGAASVLGIEGRPELVAEYAAFPETPFKSNVQIIAGDFIAEMDRLLVEGARFELVACLGVYYHTMQHYRMMMQMTAFRPRLIIIDSMFSRSAEAVIEVGWEDTAHELNSTAQMVGQNKVPTGRPSLAAVSMMAESVGYTMTEQPWDVPKEQRASVADYHDKFANRRRHTVSFTPTSPLT